MTTANCVCSKSSSDPVANTRADPPMAWSAGRHQSVPITKVGSSGGRGRQEWRETGECVRSIPRARYERGCVSLPPSPPRLADRGLIGCRVRPVARCGKVGQRADWSRCALYVGCWVGYDANGYRKVRAFSDHLKFGGHDGSPYIVGQ